MELRNILQTTEGLKFPRKEIGNGLKSEIYQEVSQGLAFRA